jgi:hypothetical protein
VSFKGLGDEEMIGGKPRVVTVAVVDCVMPREPSNSKVRSSVPGD